MNLTIQVKKKKLEFQSKHIPKHEVWILPLFVLCGLKNHAADIVDLIDLAQYFTPREDTNEITKICNDLRMFVEKATPQYSEKLLATLSYGSNHCDEPWPLEYFYEENSKLLKKYEFDEFSITKYIFLGRSEKNWYPHTLKAFQEKFKGYDIELFVKLFAITSPRNNFKANLVQANRAYDLYQKGKSFENAGFLPSVVNILNDFRSEKFTFEKGTRNGRRKITNFAHAILGDKNAVVVDSWIMRAFNLVEEYEWRGVKAPHNPRTTEYDLIENYIKRLAEVSDYEPRQIISMLWRGTRITHSNHKLTKTSKVLEEVF